MYPKAEILFPVTLIPRLRNLKGPEWATLVDRINPLPEMHPDKLAFCLLMIRLAGCLKCYSGSYKFMRGCEACAVQSVMQFKGTEEELLQMYAQAQQDLDAYLSGATKPAEVQTTP